MVNDLLERKDYLVKVFKDDRRCSSGERMVRFQQHKDIDLQTLRHLYLTTWFKKDGYRHEFWDVALRDLLSH
jgi:hypothetical protein